MGRSKRSCLRMIACTGGADVDDDGDNSMAESKTSSDRRRWSFRKRSTRHRVLSNSVVSDPVSVSYNKESIQVPMNTFDSPIYSSIPGKKPTEQKINETFPLPSAVMNSGVANLLATDENSIANDIHLDESVVIVIQAATRGFLARRGLQKLKSVVKLQAAVRGHLVRRQAIGTLRCVQAIVKLQAFVRAHHKCQLVEKLAAQENKLQVHSQRSRLLEKENSCIKPNKTYSSTKILLSNGFAHQLLEAAPKKKPIHIKCDASKSDDSAWKWLERWMAVTSSDIGQQLEKKFNQGCQGREEITELVDFEASKEVPPAVFVSYDAEFAPEEIRVLANGKGVVTAKNSGNLKFEAPISVPDNCSISLVKDDQEKTQFKNETLGITQENHMKIENVNETTTDSLSSQKHLKSNSAEKIVLDDVSEKPDFDCNGLKNTSNSAVFEPVGTEGKKLVQGLRKPCNPAFAAAQSKFEVPTSSSSISRCSNSAYQDATAKSKLDSYNFQIDASKESKDISFTENSVSCDPRVQIATSECDTEISISSTLDSPDRSETEGGEIVLEIESLEKGHHDVSGDADTDLNLKMKTEDKNSSFDSEVLQPQQPEESAGNLLNSTAANDVVQVEQQPAEPTTPDMPTQLENSVDPQMRSSLEGTPKSCTTVTEAHGTPSSQISVNAKKSKKDDNMPIQKQRSQLAGKRSPSNPNNDSGGRTEQLTRDSKNAKRRSSFGMAKPDHIDHEHRISSSNSLPSYMQATKSARAKAHASISPKLSPDVHDNQMKKRHSLPMANDKQGSSPRMQRSTSQAQQYSKGNATHSPHNSAERRWQR
ncbi:protein IQ-DOMAIN 32-like isoform X1 [Phoenix dactylifera]|uniref:Protein IQ-DOMAIN 32-like isoform X1 n=1 Tax=Phoenix dactylifera TaxID=42345 RepID=A0A8B8ZJL4_PHODC|nr:protein IQ-DOMAIN 32-like isoform X1 [Phoenix dactylifera]